MIFAGNLLFLRKAMGTLDRYKVKYASVGLAVFFELFTDHRFTGY